MTGFAVLPPEVNSARMYSGAGSAPLLAAAAGWDRLAAALTSAAGSYRSVTTSLTDGPWQGGSAVAMSAAAQPFSAWLDATAAQAAQTAGQARVAAAAYEAAFAATVPPPVIAANRAALSSLVSGNILGQNTAAIAANQADYEQMWAQDVVAMQTYAAGSAAATPDSGALSAAPQTTNPAGSQAGTAAPAASTADNSLADFLNNNPLESMLNSPFVTGAESLWGHLNGFTMAYGGATGLGGALSMASTTPAMGATAAMHSFMMITSGMPELASSTSGGKQQFTLAGSYAGAASPAAAPPAMRVTVAEVSAAAGRAAPVGELSVPPSWAGSAQGVRLASATLPASLTALPAAGLETKHGWLSHVPPMVGVVNVPRNARSRRRTGAASARPAAGTAGLEADAEYRSALVEDVQNALSGRDQLNRMRRAVAEMSQQQEALECSVASMIKAGGR
ncbi:PPE family protein [[Mycobacterium] zoologicum]|uniref:PPE family protein n=1 Tax=[Mycobacterium] zoologicum TaxID=2872311 RepID=UPI002C774AA2|nr:PPE family protein [Mycolicibacter sp. MYC101]MEB3062078.1 PPE family protein [Mycolicibacter sp. MYC101]